MKKLLLIALLSLGAATLEARYGYGNTVYDSGWALVTEKSSSPYRLVYPDEDENVDSSSGWRLVYPGEDIAEDSSSGWNLVYPE